jgi:hypothetical protein
MRVSAVRVDVVHGGGPVVAKVLGDGDGRAVCLFHNLGGIDDVYFSR